MSFPLVATFLHATAASATEFSRALDIGELMARADDVVVGEVEAVDAYWTEDGLIESQVTLRTRDSVLSAVRGQTDFWMPGGTVGEVTLTVPSATLPDVGEEVMVFLGPRRPVALGRGVWRAIDGRYVPSAVDEGTVDPLSEAAVMGDRGSVADCLMGLREEAAVDGWMLRGQLDRGSRAQSSRGVALSLLEGLDYRLLFCVDGQVESARAEVFSSDDQLISSVSLSNRGVTLDLHPERTGQHVVVIEAGDLKADVWRSRFGVAIVYR